MTPYIIGIDIGGTNYRIGAVDRQGLVLGSKVGRSKFLLQAEDPILKLGHSIECFIHEMEGLPAGICIGFPGMVSRDNRIVYSCPLFPVFDNKDIATPLSQRFGIPVIAVHDVVSLLTFDIFEHRLFDLNTIVAIYLGTGLGNALYVNGMVLNGANGVAGELGHIPWPCEDTLCSCGNIGCLELACSGKYLEKVQESYFSDTDISQIFVQHGNHSVIRDFVDNIAAAIAVEVNILDPDCVVLGGGVLQMEAFPFDDLLQALKRHVRKQYPCNSLNVCKAVPDGLAGVKGAGRYMWDWLKGGGI